jgi:hypothetical protein
MRYDLYIKGKIDLLPKEERAELEENLANLLECKEWLTLWGFDCNDPDEEAVREFLFARKEEHEKMKEDYHIPSASSSAVYCND